MEIISHPSPNHNSRDGHIIDMLVLHYTGMQSGANAIDRLCDETAHVSAHYVIELDGRIFKLVEESERAWHAGVSYWRGNTNINQRSIGIEIVNRGHEFGYHPFPKVQMESVAELCKQIIARHPVHARNVVGHSDVAPTRKIDPGELFDWCGLAKHNIGLWPEEQFSNCSLLNPQLLNQYGYDVTDLAMAIIAFQRRYSPSLLNKPWNNECQVKLECLLKNC